jgi:hypothetical protein
MFLFGGYGLLVDKENQGKTLPVLWEKKRIKREGSVGRRSK